MCLYGVNDISFSGFVNIVVVSSTFWLTELMSLYFCSQNVARS